MITRKHILRERNVRKIAEECKEREIDESIWIAASKGDLHEETKKAVLFLREDTTRNTINATPTNDMREKTSSERSGGCKCFFRSTLEMEKNGNCGGTSIRSVKWSCLAHNNENYEQLIERNFPDTPRMGLSPCHMPSCSKNIRFSSWRSRCNLH